MIDLDAFQSPTDLMAAAGVKPASPASECFLDATQACAPTKAQRQIWKSISKMRWPKEPPNIITRCTGRGSFKTTDGASLTAFHALCIGHDKHALAGSRIHHAVIGPRKKQSAEAVRIVRVTLDSLKALGVEYDVRDGSGDSVEIIITKPRRACERVITVFPADSAAPRGNAYASLHILEHGHMNAGVDYGRSEEAAVLQAIMPRLAQFPRAQLYSESTPGPPEGTFYTWVTKPPAGSLLVTGSAFLFNPTLTEAEARKWCPDPRVYTQEILANSWGHAGDSFLDQIACQRTIDRATEFTGRGPRTGFFALGVDLAQVHDASAFCVVSVHERVIDDASSPVKYYVVEFIEKMQGTKTRPLESDELQDRAIAISRAFPTSRKGAGCPLVFDMHLAIDLKAALRKLHYREATDVRRLHAGTFLQLGMDAASQTSRFRMLRELVHSGRLKIPDTPTGRELASQLANLRAWELPNHLLRIEAKHDDLADACALAVQAAQHLPSNDLGGVEVEYGPAIWHESPLTIHGCEPRYFRRAPNGSRENCEPPFSTAPGSPFELWVEERIMNGEYTPSVYRYLKFKETEMNDE